MELLLIMREVSLEWMSVELPSQQRSQPPVGAREAVEEELEEAELDESVHASRLSSNACLNAGVAVGQLRVPMPRTRGRGTTVARTRTTSCFAPTSKWTC